MTQLSVNVNKIALLRNSRNLGIPSVTRCAQLCVDAGAAGITVHPRPDQRHIRPGDVTDLAKMLTVEFNIEGNPLAGPEGTYPGFMEIVRAARPTQATLVPDDPGQLTSDHGWDLTPAARTRLAPLVREMKALGIRVSLFMDADPSRMRGAAELGSDRVELYTEPYARAFAKSMDLPCAQEGEPDAVTFHKAMIEYARDLLRDESTDDFAPWSKRMMDEFGDDVDLGPFLAGWYTEANEELRAERESIHRFAEAAKAAQNLGLGVNAGHDLNLENLGVFVKGVPNVLEVSIGHALVAEALEMGLEKTVHAYVAILAAR